MVAVQPLPPVGTACENSFAAQLDLTLLDSMADTGKIGSPAVHWNSAQVLWFEWIINIYSFTVCNQPFFYLFNQQTGEGAEKVLKDLYECKASMLYLDSVGYCFRKIQSLKVIFIWQHSKIILYRGNTRSEPQKLRSTVNCVFIYLSPLLHMLFINLFIRYHWSLTDWSLFITVPHSGQYVFYILLYHVFMLSHFCPFLVLYIFLFSLQPTSHSFPCFSLFVFIPSSLETLRSLSAVCNHVL